MKERERHKGNLREVSECERETNRQTKTDRQPGRHTEKQEQALSENNREKK